VAVGSLISYLISTEVGNLFLRQETVTETKYFLVSVFSPSVVFLKHSYLVRTQT